MCDDVFVVVGNDAFFPVRGNDAVVEAIKSCTCCWYSSAGDDVVRDVVVAVNDF